MSQQSEERHDAAAQGDINPTALRRQTTFTERELAVKRPEYSRRMERIRSKQGMYLCASAQIHHCPDVECLLCARKVALKE